MKDIDFDELDRAVNSLMSTVPSDKPADAATPTQSTPVTVNPPSETNDVAEQPEAVDAMPSAPTVLDLDAPANEPELDVPQEQAEVETLNEAMQLVDETPSPAPTPVVRRGRFMDMVRPAVREVGKSAPSSAVSRQGVSLQPSMAPADESSVAPDAMSVQQDAPSSEQNVDEAAALDFSAFESIGDVESTASDDKDTEAPLSSPFLPDAKVEKRPLGRPLEAAPAVDLAAELATSATNVSDATSSNAMAEDNISPDKDAQLPEQPLPAELGSELLSIETSADTVPLEQPQPVVTPEATPVSAAPVTPAPEPARTMMGASIPQQYKIQPQRPVDEAPTGAIYDAQPLVHTAEKKSNWIWKVVAIIAIALLGAGGGAAIYYLGLI